MELVKLRGRRHGWTAAGKPGSGNNKQCERQKARSGEVHSYLSPCTFDEAHPDRSRNGRIVRQFSSKVLQLTRKKNKLSHHEAANGR
jgi:hypothetical protein